MSGAGIYSPENYERIYQRYTLEQCRNGGKVRSAKAKRHPLGFFLPDSVDTVSLPENYVHGRAGGLARAAQIKANKESKQ